MPKVAHGKVKHALEVRSLGFGIRGKTKKELMVILSKALRYELRYLGVRRALRVEAAPLVVELAQVDQDGRVHQAMIKNEPAWQ